MWNVGSTGCAFILFASLRIATFTAHWKPHNDWVVQWLVRHVWLFLCYSWLWTMLGIAVCVYFVFCRLHVWSLNICSREHKLRPAIRVLLVHIFKRCHLTLEALWMLPLSLILFMYVATLLLRLLACCHFPSIQTHIFASKWHWCKRIWSHFFYILFICC